MKKALWIFGLAVLAWPLAAQTDRHELRAGNRKFSKGKWAEAELDYRRGLLKDSLSVPGAYNLASALYRQEDYDGAMKAFENRDELAEATPHAASWYYNKGDAAIAKKDWRAAVDALRECLLLTPGDMDAKENYIYAKEMLRREEQQQQQGGGGQNQQNQDQQNQDQNQNQNQDQQQDQQQQDQDQDQNQDQDQRQQQGREPEMTPQQARQMLRAVQAKEQETQEKVKKEKAALLKSRQKEKNW
ncbi:MAG: tetratricopeptide repeat protein [Bacteroidales bacterium]|nr:tetratricopeptide repeat protein [Bacteroidales bacterium]